VKLRILIDHIKAECPAFAGRVAGAAEFAAAAAEADRLAVPHAFVIRLVEDVEPSITAGAVEQPSEEWFGIVVCVSNTADARGQGGDDTLDDVRAELRAALKGWQPDADHAPMEYRGFETLDLTRARLWRRFDFSTLTSEP